MKQSIFLTVAIIATAAIAFIIYIFVLGNPANFANGEVRTSNLVRPVDLAVKRLTFWSIFPRQSVD